MNNDLPLLCLIKRGIRGLKIIDLEYRKIHRDS